MTGPTSSGSRKRTKTFTGCWTCRKRKVKCDETLPECRQCQRKHLTCEGYGTRLQWLPPVVAFPSGDIVGLESTDPVPSASSRRSLLPRCSQAVLSPSQVDGILRYLDAAEHTQLSTSDDAALYDHNFAVFSSRPILHCPGNKGVSVQIPSSKAPGLRFADEDQVVPESFPHTPFHDVTLHGADAPEQSTLLLEETEIEASTDHVLTEEIPATQDYVPTALPIEASDGLETNETAKDGWLDAGGSPPGSPHSDVDLDRFLMRHYAERVCHLFCVVHTAKSPWKTIHLPRALQSMGELSVTGKTTTVRSALRNALLSISAWYLSNDHHRHQNTELGQRWATVAAKYGYNAIAMLKQAVASDMYSSPKPKYKEFLASMLSMVTINVMSGDTHTCGVHLDGAGQLINFLWNRKRSLSDKTRALYSIYCYLRVIYESTLVQGTEEPVQRESSVFCFFDHVEIDATTGKSPSTSEQASDTAMFECIYGIPQRLLAMLEQVTKLIQRVDNFRAANGSAHLPDEINSVCDQVEHDILDWTMIDDTSLSLTADNNASRSIIRHQTRAFHGALVIFFSQNIRLLDHRYLRKDVENILESIETIEHIKAETNMLAAPIFWPAFIAATEAFDPKHQARFKKWHDEVTSYGIASVRTGIDVVNGVWKMGPSRAKRHTSLWRTVVSRDGNSLMLS